MYTKLYLSLRRFLNRLKYLIRFGRAWRWTGESCDDCGRCYRFYYHVTDEVWLRINGTDSGLLCLECLINKANRHGITVTVSDFEDIQMLGGPAWGSETVLDRSE